MHLHLFSIDWKINIGIKRYETNSKNRTHQYEKIFCLANCFTDHYIEITYLYTFWSSCYNSIHQDNICLQCLGKVHHNSHLYRCIFLCPYCKIQFLGHHIYILLIGKIVVQIKRYASIWRTKLINIRKILLCKLVYVPWFSNNLLSHILL